MANFRLPELLFAKLFNKNVNREKTINVRVQSGNFLHRTKRAKNKIKIDKRQKIISKNKNPMKN
jgi:hypothetical protein